MGAEQSSRPFFLTADSFEVILMFSCGFDIMIIYSYQACPKNVLGSFPAALADKIV